MNVCLSVRSKTPSTRMKVINHHVAFLGREIKNIYVFFDICRMQMMNEIHRHLISINVYRFTEIYFVFAFGFTPG